LRWQGPPDAHRFGHPDVKSVVEAADLVCVQEVYLSDAETFFDALGFEHKTRDDNRSTLWPLTFGGSGLAVASRYPIVERWMRAFSRPHVGTERFARKGMLHVRVRVPNGHRLEIDVMTTHLQAGYDVRARSVRERQLREIRDLVDEVGSRERPFVMCGDLNIDGLSGVRHGSEYAALVATLSDFIDLGADDDLATFHPHPDINELAHRYDNKAPRQRIDYVFYRPPANGTPAAERCVLVHATPIECSINGRTYASDHFGLQASFSLGK
jgi:endonuclease/exonuclease/phosphatase family metal-dependent hydrolase